MKGLVVLVAGLVLVLGPAVYAQDGLRSASLPERPIATPPPGPGDLFRATPNTYRPHDRPVLPRPPINGRGSGPVRPEHPIHGRGGSSYWPYTGYWPYFPDPVETTTSPSPRAAADGGRLQLRVAPADALVYIDGEYEGSADDLREPGALLRAGSHRVRLEANGYASHTFDVRIADGETVTHRSTLDRDVTATSRQPAPVAAATQSKPMYVIPLCYAGDKPPDPATTHCDLTQLRTIR